MTPPGRRRPGPDAEWEELELVTHWRRYLEAPTRYLRHVIETD